MNVFEIVRERVTLDRVLSVSGSAKARCVTPDHQDVSPSMHLYEDHAHCFACGFHGDVTDVWAAQRGFARPIEAAVDLAREFNVRLPEMSEEGRRKAQDQRKMEADNLKLARACHDALEKHPRVREWWQGRGFGNDLQKRFLLGTNEDGTEAVVPFRSRGRVVGLIRRRLQGEPKYVLPAAEGFPEGHKPLFIPSPLKGEIYLVEGYIDALAVAATGKSVVAMGGTNASKGHLAELERIGKKICVLPDCDERGAGAAREWARKLYPAAKIWPADYGEGGKDVADLFASRGVDGTIEHLNRLAAGSRDILDIEMESAAKIEDRRERLAHTTRTIVPLLVPLSPAGLRDATADIVAEEVKLKKRWLDKAIGDEINRRGEEVYKEYIAQKAAEAERLHQEHQARIEEAQDEIDALFAPGVLGRLRDIAAKMHHVYGDREPLELALLVALGAQLEPLPNGRPLGASILLTAEAGRGKNHIVDAAVKPLPPEFYFAFEIALGQSLYYKADEDPEFLKHTFAYPNEIEGVEALWEFLRPMLSKGSAKKTVTAKDADGNPISRTIIVEGPVTIRHPDDQEQDRRAATDPAPGRRAPRLLGKG